MATETANRSVPLAARKLEVHRLWQVPLFVTGLLALVGVWISRPMWWDDQAWRFQRRLAELREVLSRTPPDSERAGVLGPDVEALSERFPDKAGEVQFLLGSNVVLLAGVARGAEALAHWQEAREHFEQAERLGVPEEDRARLSYRLGKAWYHTGVEPSRVIEYLARSVDEAGDDPADGYGMLARSYLRLPVPNVAAALEASKKQLSMPTDNDDLLAPARLLHGELLLRANEPAKARALLARIGPEAPPAVRAQARSLRARSCQAEGLWAEAAKLYEEILADTDQPPTEPGRVLCALGHCYRELGKREAALNAWEKALPYDGADAQSAAFALADSQLASNPAEALYCYERALRDVDAPQNYRNSQVDIQEARRLIERGCLHYRESGAYERARNLAQLYEKVALPGVAAEFRGQAEEAWGNERRAARNEEKARGHYAEAARAFEAVAAARPRAEQATWLRRSADLAFQAKDYPQALTVLKRLLTVETAPVALGENWFALAQVYQALEDPGSATAAYRKCIEYPGPVAFRARFRLAQADFEQGRLDDAEQALLQNLDLLRQAPDDDTHQLTLYTLAGLLYQRGQYRQAAPRLQESLERYPANPRATEARFRLADCYRRLAALENQQFTIDKRSTPEAQVHYRDQFRIWLKMAVANYQKLIDDLSAKRSRSETEEAILRQADFALAECRFDLGQYEDALRYYEILRDRYRDQVENLIALRQMWRCFWVLRQPDKARDTVKEMRSVLEGMNEKVFRNPQTGQARDDWNHWLEWAGKQ